MTRNADYDAGFSLVEVVIAMLILGLIAVALIPPLWQGVQLSSKQSIVATATRQINALVEQMREDPSCSNLSAVAVSKKYRDGAVVGSDPYDFQTETAVFTCSSRALVPVEITATDMSGTVVASVTAKVFASG
jgi:prepilin-type N-terminal cleavage/methylation domain-containing protein